MIDFEVILRYNTFCYMNQTEALNLLRTVWKNVRCPQCGKQYSFSEIKIRGVLEDVCFLELNCQNHLPLIATVFLNQKTKKENTNNISEKIVSDDVIETFKFLKDFNGGFNKYFKKGEK